MRSPARQRERDLDTLEWAVDFLLRTAEQREQVHQPAHLERAAVGAIGRALARLRETVDAPR